MNIKTKTSIFKRLLTFGPIILLFVSVLNEFDFNYLDYEYFTFNFPFILIFYWSLKKNESLGYGAVFIAGIINDVVTGFPIGVSGLTYLLICGFAAYLKNITLRPNLFNDWMFFLLTILVVTSINYFILISVFSLEFNYYELSGNIFFTFALYYFFAILFDFIYNLFFKGRKND